MRISGRVEEFIEHYNTRRYHEAFGNVTPDHVFMVGRESIQTRRRKLSGKTLARRQAENAKLAPIGYGTGRLLFIEPIIHTVADDLQFHDFRGLLYGESI